MKLLTSVLGLALVLSLAPAAHAQEWKGLGRIGGKLVDERGAPVEGATVKAMMPASQNRGPADSKTNRKGEWAVGGISRGQWALDFVKEGYQTTSISVVVQESSRIPSMELVLKKAAPVAVDPNVAIKAKLQEAAELMNAKQFVAARAIYEQLSAAYPEVTQFKPLIARAYYGEGNKTRALELLREASAAEPGNVEVRMLLGNLLMESGKAEEAKALLATVDESKVTDPVIYLNMGIGMINEGKHAEALPWFDKAIARFPEQPDAYYYRGISYLSTGKQAEAKADLLKFVAMARPDAPELPIARKILETLK